MNEVSKKIRKLRKLNPQVGREAQNIWREIKLDAIDFEIELDDAIKEWS